MLIRAKASRSAGLPLSVAGSAAVFILVAGGIFVSGLLYQSAATRQQRDLQGAIHARSQQSVELLQTKIACSLEVLHSVVALFQSHPDVSRSAFRDFVTDALRRQPEIQALGWTPRVAAAQRQAAESAIRNEGLSEFCFVEKDTAGKIIPAAQRSEYFPIYYIEPFSANRAASGFALESNSVREATLRKCCETAAPAATPPVQLLQGTNGEEGFVVYLPLYHSHRPDAASNGPQATTTEERRQDLGGFASAVFRIDHLLEPSLAELRREGLSVRVLDTTSGGTSVYDNGLPVDTTATNQASSDVIPLDVAGRRWGLVLQPTTKYVSSHSTRQPFLVLSAGLVITLLLGASVYGALYRAEVIEQRVIDRTVQLSAEISERKRAEASVRLAEAKYRSIFENAVEGIFQTTPQGRYVSANRALAEMYGYDSVAHLMGDLANIAHQLYIDPSRRDQFIQQIQRDGEVTDFESQIFRRDGSIIWISENARTVRDEHGNVLYYEGAVTNVTQRRFSEDQLRHRRDELEQRVAERTAELAATNDALRTASRAKSDFLANMSHEIRTPMNAILGYAQLLLADQSLNASQRDAVTTVLDSGTHLIALVNDILDISKIEAGAAVVQNNDFDLATMIASVGGMFRQKCHANAVKLRVETPDTTALIVNGDERKLRQVLINLLGNAVKFTDRGSVTLRVSAGVDDRFVFEVIDTGIGIPTNVQAGIFEPFQQAPGGEARGGTGLGLAIAKRLVGLMGGKLLLVSRPDEGTRFSFTVALPVSARSVALPAAVNFKPADRIIALASPHRVQALVVDDIRQNRSVLAEMLTRIGCTVRTADSGLQAIRSLDDAPADVVFIDLLMPEMDGMETARRILQRHPATGVKLVATSASSLANERQVFLDAGFHDVIPKPVQADSVHQSLSELLHVEFQFESEQPAETDEALVTALPIELRDRLRAAAEVYSVTDLKHCLAQIEQIGPSGVSLSQSLRWFVQRYDMAGIARVLDAEGATT